MSSSQRPLVKIVADLVDQLLELRDLEFLPTFELFHRVSSLNTEIVSLPENPVKDQLTLVDGGRGGLAQYLDDIQFALAEVEEYLRELNTAYKSKGRWLASTELEPIDQLWVDLQQLIIEQAKRDVQRILPTKRDFEKVMDFHDLIFRVAPDPAKPLDNKKWQFIFKEVTQLQSKMNKILQDNDFKWADE